MPEQVLALATVGAERADAHLLNGPQLPGNAMAQDAIDKLLADFD